MARLSGILINSTEENAPFSVVPLCVVIFRKVTPTLNENLLHVHAPAYAYALKHGRNVRSKQIITTALLKILFK